MSSKLLVNNKLKIKLIWKLCETERQENLLNNKVLRFMSTINSSKRLSLAERCVSLVPKEFSPYLRLMRLDKPTGSWLLMWPSFWSISLATHSAQLPSLTTLSLFGLGAVVMRGAGCVVNDLWDKDFDAKVERTKGRPLASKQLTTTDAIVLLGGLSGCGLLVLLQFDMNSIILGASSLLLVTSYPYFKRFTYWPQVVLGMTFNWGALLGWSVVMNGSIDLTAVLPLYFAGICWTLVYDTIYAHQDKADDLMVGLKSTAIKFGDKTAKWLSGFSVLMCSSLVITGINTNQCWPYYTAVTITGLNLAHQMFTLKINDSNDCWRKFKQNTQIGWILFIGIVLSNYLKDEDKDKEKKIIEQKDSLETIIANNSTLNL